MCLGNFWRWLSTCWWDGHVYTCGVGLHSWLSVLQSKFLMLLDLAVFLDSRHWTWSYCLVWHLRRRLCFFIADRDSFWRCDLWINTAFHLSLALRRKDLVLSVACPRHILLVVHHRLGQWKHLLEFRSRSAEAVQRYYWHLVTRAVQTGLTHTSWSLGFIELVLVPVLFAQCRMTHELRWNGSVFWSSHFASIWYVWTCCLKHLLRVVLFDFWTMDFGCGRMVRFQIKVLKGLIAMTLNAPMMPKCRGLWNLVGADIRRGNLLLVAFFFKWEDQLFWLSGLDLAGSSLTFIVLFRNGLTTRRFEACLTFFFSAACELLVGMHLRSLHFNQTLRRAFLHLLV